MTVTSPETPEPQPINVPVAFEMLQRIEHQELLLAKRKKELDLHLAKLTPEELEEYNSGAEEIKHGFAQKRHEAGL